MKFTVDRSKWKNRNHGPGNTNLLNPFGFRCCLGFCQSQLGIPDRHLFEVGTPAGISWKANSLDEDSYDADNIFTVKDRKSELSLTELSTRAISLNDSLSHTDKDRETLLKKAFLEAGHEIEFIGEFQD